MEIQRTALLIAVLCFQQTALAGVSCQADTQFASLGDLFLGVASGTYSSTSKNCQYPYEGNALAPATYKYCSNWAAQKSLEYLDEAILDSLLMLHEKKAAIGGGKFGIENQFTYTGYDANSKTLQARQRLIINLLGKKLRLPPHKMAAIMAPPAGQGGASRAAWQTDNYRFSAEVGIPTALGSFQFGLAANYSDNNANPNTADRSRIYSGLKERQWNISADWDAATFNNLANSTHWSDYNLHNAWTLSIASPWVGPSAGLSAIASARLRLKLAADISGKLHYAEAWSLTEPNPKHACPAADAALVSQLALAAQATGSGDIEIRVRIPFYSYTKVFELFSESASSGDVFFPGGGNALLALHIPVDVTRCRLGACEQEPKEPPPPSLSALQNPPPADTSDPRADLPGFAEEIVEELVNTYYICDRDKAEWIASRDRIVRELANRSQRSAGLSPADQVRLERYLKENVFLCERTCDGVCRQKAKTEKGTKLEREREGN